MKRQQQPPISVCIWRHTLQLLFTQRILILVKIKKTFGNRRGSRLIIRIMIRLQVRMTQSILDGDTFGRVEREQLLEQIEGQVVAFGEEGLGRDPPAEGKRTDVFTGTPRFDPVVILHCRGAENVKDEG